MWSTGKNNFDLCQTKAAHLDNQFMYKNTFKRQAEAILCQCQITPGIKFVALPYRICIKNNLFKALIEAALCKFVTDKYNGVNVCTHCTSHAVI